MRDYTTLSLALRKWCSTLENRIGGLFCKTHNGHRHAAKVNQLTIHICRIECFGQIQTPYHHTGLVTTQVNDTASNLNRLKWHERTARAHKNGDDRLGTRARPSIPACRWSRRKKGRKTQEIIENYTRALIWQFDHIIVSSDARAIWMWTLLDWAHIRITCQVFSHPNWVAPTDIWRSSEKTQTNTKNNRIMCQR